MAVMRFSKVHISNANFCLCKTMHVVHCSLQYTESSTSGRCIMLLRLNDTL